MLLATWVFLSKTRRRKQVAVLVAAILALLYVLTYLRLFERELEQEEAVSLPPETTSSEDEPIVIWWTPFTPNQRIIRSCSAGNCLITHSRSELSNPRTEAIVFYGSDLKWSDLPLPRDPRLYWALLHEESPKNNWGFATDEGIALFNLTSTPSRHSSYPLVTQYLEDTQKLLRPLKIPVEEKSKGGLGLVMYLHSDCGTPSDRDSYVNELMKYVKVDSYGKCLHNKDFPEGHLRDALAGMDSEDFIDIISQYKFALAMENAICHDYITEKFWRPFYSGTVPVVKGSPTSRDWAPSNHSIILIDDFKSPKELAEYLLYLDKNDEEYMKYLEYKNTGITNDRLAKAMKEREWKVTISDYSDKNMVESYECFVCDKVHERQRKEREGVPLDPIVANQSHYDCKFPELSVATTSISRFGETEFWRQVAKRSEYQANAIGPAITAGKIQKVVSLLYENAANDMSSEEWEITNKF